MKRRFLTVAVAGLFCAAWCASASAARYIVLYKHQSLDKGTSATIAAAGGSVVASYPQIGVLIAESNSPTFSSKLSADSRVDGVAATGTFGVQINDGFGVSGRKPAAAAPAVTPTLTPATR